MPKNFIRIDKKIKSFKKKLNVDGDKSLSIRWALIASQAIGTSKAKNLLQSEDVNNTLRCLKKLGIKISQYQNIGLIDGRGINGVVFKEYNLRRWKFWNIRKIDFIIINKITV